MSRLLLVDDEWLISTAVIGRVLEDNGHSVCIANDGEEGVERAVKEQPEIIITDYMMPRMDGLEMVRQLREVNFKGAIILASALASNNESAFDIFLRKPFTEIELLRAVEKAEKSIAQAASGESPGVLVQRYIIEQEQRIARQRELVSRLSSGGYPTAQAEHLLGLMLDLLALLRANLARLRG